MHAGFRVAEYLGVDEKSAASEYDDRPPALMTKEVLAKFRMMEAEQQAARQQVPQLRRQVCMGQCHSMSGSDLGLGKRRVH